MKAFLHKLKNSPKFLSAVGLLGFATIGTVLLVSSHAATPTVNFEAEAGTRTGNASVVSDSGASGTSAVKFGSGGGTASCSAGADVPGSADRWGGCWPGPNNTGWQHTGVTLQTVPGQKTSGTGWEWNGSPFNYVKVTGNNAVLDGLDIGCVFVDEGVTKVTITRSRITCSDNYSIRIAESPTMIITDVEFVGGAVQNVGAMTWTRVNAHSFTGKAAMLSSNATVQDSYVHDNVCNPPDHQSAIGTNGGASHMVMQHNTVDLTPSECTSGGISNYDDFGAFHDIVIQKNLINSAGYCLKAGFEDNNALGSDGEQVINNVFGRKYNPECGSFGVVSNWMPSVSGNVWSGNTWGGGAAATSAHAVGDPVLP